MVVKGDFAVGNRWVGCVAIDAVADSSNKTAYVRNHVVLRDVL